MRRALLSALAAMAGFAGACAPRAAFASPVGYVRQTIPVTAPPVALAFDDAGRLFVLQQAGFGSNAATMRVFDSQGEQATSFAVVGDDDLNFFVGGMAYDPLGGRMLITDNTSSGRIYAVDATGLQTTIAQNIPTMAGIAVRSTGEILVTTAIGFGNGGVYEIDRATGGKTLRMLGLDYGAGLAFDAGGDLIVQDSESVAPYEGRLQRVPTTSNPGGLALGSPSEILRDMSAAYGVVVDFDGDMFVTGRGGVFVVEGDPPLATLFSSTGNPSQFATAAAFRSGVAPFEAFAGPEGGMLAVTADGGFMSQDLFVTVFTPAWAEDFNSDGRVDGADLAILAANFGAEQATRDRGDANGDGTVDGVDALHWQRRAGATSLFPHVPPVTSLASSVPESDSLILAILSGGAIVAASIRSSSVRRRVF